MKLEGIYFIFKNDNNFDPYACRHLWYYCHLFEIMVEYTVYEKLFTVPGMFFGINHRLLSSELF